MPLERYVIINLPLRITSQSNEDIHQCLLNINTDNCSINILSSIRGMMVLRAKMNALDR